MQNLFGLSARKVYHTPSITIRVVDSYSTFSPFPQTEDRLEVVCFLWHLLYPIRMLPFQKYATLCCPDFPLLSLNRSDESVCGAKIWINALTVIFNTCLVFGWHAHKSKFFNGRTIYQKTQFFQFTTVFNGLVMPDNANILVNFKPYCGAFSFQPLYST